VYTLVRSLRSIQIAGPDLAKEILTEAGYFAKNIERMRYPRFRDQHLFVGSGVIEAGGQTVVGIRKQSGMFRTVRGANAILALRRGQMNGEFEDYWESRVARSPLPCRAQPANPLTTRSPVASCPAQWRRAALQLNWGKAKNFSFSFDFFEIGSHLIGTFGRPHPRMR
jgi:hypothetical protein